MFVADFEGFTVHSNCSISAVVTLAMMLFHNGCWDCCGKYVDYRVVISTESSYEALVSAIGLNYHQTSLSRVEVQYIVNDRSPPMEICKDMGVRVYVETKKYYKDISMYPLCITTKELLIEENCSTCSIVVYN